MKRTIIRPISVMSIFFISLGFLSLGGEIFVFMNIKDFFAEGTISIFLFIFTVAALAWLSLQMFYISFKPKIQIKDNQLMVIFWKNGTPYKRGQTFLQQLKLPEVEIQTFDLKDIYLYGVFLYKDIQDVITPESGFNQEFYIKGIQMPEMLKGLQEVMLFFSKNKEMAAVSRETYSVKQIEYLFGRIYDFTRVFPSGRIQSISKTYSFGIDILGSILLFLIGVFLILILPFGTIFLEGLFNYVHSPAYDSGYRTVYVVSIMLANMILLLFISTFGKTYGKDKDINMIRWISFLGALILYLIFIVSFILSINH